MTVVDRAMQGALAIRTEPVEPFDAIAVYAAAVEAGLEAALWVRPSEDFALVGIGRAWAVEADGPERFAVADAAWQALVTSFAAAPDHDGDGRRAGGRDRELPRGVGPVLLGGLGFFGRPPEPDDAWAPFGASSLVLPEWIGARTPDGTWLTTTTAESTEPAA